MKIVLDRKLIQDVGDNYGIGTEQDMFGIEVELEGNHIVTGKESVSKYWSPHQDGSLRVQKEAAQAIEYVFKRPLAMEDTEKALKSLFEFLTNTPGTEVFDSYRTSIHVHVNCLNESIRTIVNFITLAIIFDELLVSQNGETRQGNNFCLRSKDAEGQIADLITSVTKHGNLFNLHPENRYSSTNFSSLLKFGTIEFRSLECTTDFQRVMHWINTLQSLKVAARQYENPREIISKFSKRGPFGFVISHLGEQYAKYTAVPGMHQMLHNGMRLAQDFAFCSEWQQPDPGEIKEPKAVRSRYKELLPGPALQAYQQVLAQAAQPQPAPGGLHWQHIDPFAPQPPQPAPQHLWIQQPAVVEEEDDDVEEFMEEDEEEVIEDDDFQ